MKRIRRINTTRPEKGSEYVASRPVTTEDAANRSVGIRTNRNIRHGHLAKGMRDASHIKLAQWEESVANTQRMTDVQRLEYSNRFYDAVERIQGLMAAVNERNEELQTSNEELSAMNEEMQAVTEELERTNSYLQTLMDTMVDVLLVTDKNGVITEANLAAERLSGYSAQELYMQPFYQFFANPESARAGIESTLTGGQVSDYELTVATKDGREIPVMCNAITLQGSDGNIMGVLINARNITRIKQASKELADAKERAEAADRVKSTFLSTMSHELRTPLNSIIGFTGIILRGLAGPLNDEQTKQLGMVLKSAQHLLDLINDVLDISRIEAGQLEITFQAFDMREVIEKAMRTITPLAEGKGLTLVAQMEPEVGEVVSGRRQVEQILINLINNAVKFTEKGEVRVKCQISDGWLMTSVADTGIGIKPEDMGKIFEAFQQTDNGLTHPNKGTGLGLSICKKLVEMLGGEIQAESEWGVGSTFTFTLPM